LLAGYLHLLAAGRRLQWDAGQHDLSADRVRWRGASRDERRQLGELLAGFWVAEHQVAEHLTPFIAVAEDAEARDCFELQAGDERRHAAFFERAMREVARLDPERDARELAGSEIVELFDRRLPAMAEALARADAALGDAVALYHLVLEAIVLSAGQAALLERAAGYPGLGDGVARVQADERWHVGLGVQAFGGEGRAPGPELDALAERAASAWGPRVATPERVRDTVATHRRRTSLLARVALASRDTED
jgi:ribonucleotide reductase beta subunit family protein with ferritin-like domain